MASNDKYGFPSAEDTTKLQSLTIDLLRFPLAIMVIFIHMTPYIVNLIDAEFNLLSGEGFVNVIKILFSYIIPRIAVPTFFFISGFLFFYNFNNWDWSNYKQKIKKRTKTLFLPYILWNLIPFLIVVATNFILAVIKKETFSETYSFINEYSWHIFYDCKDMETTCINWLGENLKEFGPYDFPLWFVRDLIVVSILSPCIYYVIKKLRLFALVILFIAYISRIWTFLPGFSITSLFFFSVGAYFALNQINIVAFATKHKNIFIPTNIILLIITTIYGGVRTVVGQNLIPFFDCSGLFVAFYIGSLCITKYNMRPNRFLISSCFFIYAFHLVVIPFIDRPLYFFKRTLYGLIPDDSILGDGFCYIITPFITAGISILIFVIAKKIFPKATLFFSGNK